LVFYPAAVLCLGLLAARVVEGATRLPARGRLVSALLPVAGVTVLATTLAGEPVDPAMAPAPESRALGRAAGEYLAPGQAIYTFDWYAPSIGYYAERPWHLLSSDPRVTRAMSNTTPFRYAHNIAAVPPWPSGQLVVAGHRQRLAAAPGLRIITVLAERGPWLLVRAEVGRGPAASR
ncbi:MAG: hypothetical protein AAGC55_29680, partial [Myxococcota bacterium]